MTFKLTKNQMLIEAVEHYIYSMQKVNANQAAIDVYTELLNELEAEEEEEENENEEKFSYPCPDCGTELQSVSGGGVKCPNKDCGYWFCY